MYKILKFKYLIDDMTIDLWSFGNFASIEDIKRNCNPMVDLSKFISNKKIFSEIVILDYITKFVVKICPTQFYI